MADLKQTRNEAAEAFFKDIFCNIAVGCIRKVRMTTVSVAGLRWSSVESTNTR
jgi:hypothetical protein